MKRTLTLLFAMLFVIAISCKKDDPKPAPSGNDNQKEQQDPPGQQDPPEQQNPPTEQKVEVTEVTLNKTTLTLVVETEGTLTATIDPENATDKTINWSSSKTDIATVDDSGKVTAVAAGEATIIAATSNGKTATCTVTVVVPGTPKTINGIECVYIPAGEFIMGASDEEEYHTYGEPEHKVIITKDFYLGKYEVTNAQYCVFLNNKKIDGSGKYTTESYGEQVMVKEFEWGVKYADGEWMPIEGKEDFPIVGVSWYGADEFCRWAGGQLPTEAQWEYACKAGTNTRFFFGDDENLYPQYAVYNGVDDKTHKVGSLKPNPWGLYDMYGNVWEWCSDWYDGNYYSNSPLYDPEQKNETGERSIRGGSYWNPIRPYNFIRGDGPSPSWKGSDVGFRLCYLP